MNKVPENNSSLVDTFWGKEMTNIRRKIKTPTQLKAKLQSTTF